MPRPPHFTERVQRMPGAVYSPFADRLRDHPGPLYPLHVGDTWMTPCDGARMEDLRSEAHAGLHNYCDTRGLPALVDALVEKVRTRAAVACEREQVLVTAGATAGLSCALGAIATAGEEVLTLAPFWPLIRGIVQTYGAVPVEVPFYDRVDSAEAAVEAVAARCSERTVALYVSTPSNPTGVVLPERWLEALARFAEERDLWLISDEVYEDFVYRGEHVPLARLAEARTLSVHSFSKAYGMAGNRVGYLVGPEPLIAEARKIGTHSFYNAPTAGQLAALRALEGGGAWQAEARRSYRQVGEAAAKALGLSEPEGSTFFFIDVRERLDERGLYGVLEDCFEAGVLVAPGSSSGTDYGDWIRLCYTVMPPDDVAEAVRRLAGVLS